MKKLLLFFIISLSFIRLHAAYHQSHGWGFTKPPVGTPVNWDDPITQGLLFFAPMNDKGIQFTYDIARGKKGVSDSAQAFPSWSAGKFEGPSTSYVNANSNNINFGNFIPAMSSFTFGCWVKSSTVAFDMTFMNLGHTGSGTGNVFQLSAPIASFPAFRFTTRSDAATFLFLEGGTVSATVWQHVVGVRKGTTITLYVNGIQVGTNTGAQGAITPNDLTTGSTVTTGLSQQYLTGNIDLPFVYNRALSLREIRKLYEEPMCLFAPHKIHFQTINQTITNLIRSFGQIF